MAHADQSFWRPVTPNTILVIPDNPNNRRDYDEEVLKTIHLTNPLAPADRTAITTALKQVLGLQRIMDNPDSNAIIIRDTPAKVAAAEQLVRELDRGKAEILINVDIVEADRDRIRDIGSDPGHRQRQLGRPRRGSREAAYLRSDHVDDFRDTTTAGTIPVNTFGLARHARWSSQRNGDGGFER